MVLYPYIKHCNQVSRNGEHVGNYITVLFGLFIYSTPYVSHSWGIYTRGSNSILITRVKRKPRYMLGKSQRCCSKIEMFMGAEQQSVVKSGINTHAYDKLSKCLSCFLVKVFRNIWGSLSNPSLFNDREY